MKTTIKAVVAAAALSITAQGALAFDASAVEGTYRGNFFYSESQPCTATIEIKGGPSKTKSVVEVTVESSNGAYVFPAMSVAAFEKAVEMKDGSFAINGPSERNSDGSGYYWKLSGRFNGNQLKYIDVTYGVIQGWYAGGQINNLCQIVEKN